MQSSGVHNNCGRYCELGFIAMMFRSGFGGGGRGICPLSLYQGQRNGGFIDRDRCQVVLIYTMTPPTIPHHRYIEAELLNAWAIEQGATTLQKRRILGLLDFQWFCAQPLQP
jgi:hypothetical protein